MRKIWLFLFLLVQVALQAATPHGEAARIRRQTEDNNRAALSLYEAINKAPSSNLLFSPYSIYNGMAMVYVGAKNGMADEIAKALFFRPSVRATAPILAERLMTSGTEKSYTLKMANGLWLDRDTFVLADFRHVIEDDFKADVQSLDFAKTEEAIFIINEWTANQTDKKIPKLLEAGDVDSSTRLVLTNTLYFKGNWIKPFDQKLTTASPFTVDSNTKVDAQMMAQVGFFPYCENDLFQALALPFAKEISVQSDVACVLLLPNKDQSLEDLELTLKTASFRKILDQLKGAQVRVKIPKFCLDKRTDLNAILQGMGIIQAFTPKADFSGIDGMKDLFLSKVAHEAFFSLDEVGVVAAAATAASINVTAAPPSTPIAEFTADHPFIFALVDLKSGTILFLGKLVDPSTATCE